jgi:hypothetical protein
MHGVYLDIRPDGFGAISCGQRDKAAPEDGRTSYDEDHGPGYLDIIDSQGTLIPASMQLLRRI